MPPSVTPLTARSQTTIAALIGIAAVMGLSPMFDIVATRWPMRFSELPWRYDTLSLILTSGPQLLILVSIIAIVGLVVGYRAAVRGAAIAFGLVTIIHLLVIPFYLLDYLQARHLVAQTRAAAFKATAIKSLAFGLTTVVASGWAAVLAWQSSVPENSAARRQQGEGLVVGQPKPPRTMD